MYNIPQVERPRGPAILIVRTGSFTSLSTYMALDHLEKHVSAESFLAIPMPECDIYPANEFNTLKSAVAYGFPEFAEPANASRKLA